MGEKALLQFQPGEQTPPVDKGRMRGFIVARTNEYRPGENICDAAWYLNEYPLECDYPDADAEFDDDGYVLFTGWFRDESNFEYDNCYHRLNGKVLAWSELPSPDDALAALSRHGEGK